MRGVDWEELKRHRQIMVTVRTEGTERHRLRRGGGGVVGGKPLGDPADPQERHRLGADPGAHHRPSRPSHRSWAIPALEFDEGAYPVALDVVWHKQRPEGPAAKWLRQRFATKKIDTSAP